MAALSVSSAVEFVDAVRAYALGPFVLVGERWPREWLNYLDITLARAEPDERPTLRVELGALGPSWDKKTKPVDRVNAFFDERGLRVEVDGVLRATWALDASPVVINIDEDFSLPHVTLGNVLRAAVATWLPVQGDGLMMHASSAILDGRGALFAGVSTAGKTTLALGLERGRFLSDDITLVERLATAPRLIPSPFFGSAGRRGHELDGPLVAVGLLAKSADSETRLERLGRTAALKELLRHVVAFSHDKTFSEATLARLLALVEQVPVFRIARSLETPADEVMARLLEAAAT